MPCPLIPRSVTSFQRPLCPSRNLWLSSKQGCTRRRACLCRKSGCSGGVSQLHWPRGKIKRSSSTISQMLQLGDKLVLNRGRVSRTVTWSIRQRRLHLLRLRRQDRQRRRCQGLEGEIVSAGPILATPPAQAQQNGRRPIRSVKKGSHPSGVGVWNV
jgi:hypothetical protein